VQLIESGKAEGLFPSDVIQRAKHYLAAMPGGTGAYSDSRGAMVLRKDIAKVCPIRDDDLAEARWALTQNELAEEALPKVCWEHCIAAVNSITHVLSNSVHFLSLPIRPCATTTS